MRLFETAKSVGDALGIPTYSTVVIGNSAINKDELVDAVVSDATALGCDGFYYGFDFGAGEKIPSNQQQVYRSLSAGLTLACTGKPVLHAFTGPMGFFLSAMEPLARQSDILKTFGSSIESAGTRPRMAAAAMRLLVFSPALFGEPSCTLTKSNCFLHPSEKPL